MASLFAFQKGLYYVDVILALPILFIGALLGYLIWIALYNVIFHPLRRYPGPKLWAATRIPYTYMFLSSKAHKKMLELHKTYGPVIRVAPDVVAYSHPDAIKEIRGHRKGGQGENAKDPFHSGLNRNNIVGADRKDHTRFRRALAHGFSAQAMRDQQPIILKYINLLFHKLHEECGGGTHKVDMVKWYNYTTFDIIGDLSFGESFNCLDNSAYHPWVSLVFTAVKSMAWQISMNRYSIIGSFLKKFLLPKELASTFKEHQELSQAKVAKRLAMDTDRHDFVDAMSRGASSQDQQFTFEEMTSNASALIIAGSETTATALSAATYFLGMNAHALATVTEEVRSTYTHIEEIDLVSVQKLPYLLAVLDETLRMYPPAAGGQPRMIHEGGDVILGRFVPSGTKVEVWQWPLYHNPAYFIHPDEFIPERWLGDPRFADDKKQAYLPFSIGSRNCIGQNLAYSEMRLILARLLWSFDIQLAEESQGWDERSEYYILWDKGPVCMYLTPKELGA